MSKAVVLICSDSAHLTTGFGRVAREIGTGLVRSGLFNVVQHGWFHIPSTQAIPFRVIPTAQSGQPRMTADSYGEQSFDKVVEAVHPDIVLAIGDEWMIRYMTRRARPYKLVGYVPIDGVPINRNWMNTFAALDQLVVFGDFGESAIREHEPTFPVVQIPHGVHSEVYRPLPPEDRARMRTEMWGSSDDKFVIGCVARNSPRKQLSRLIKAFRKFINPSTTCGDCGEVTFDALAVCPRCNSMNLFHTDPKKDARLYLHTVHNDPAGHQLLPLLDRFKLAGTVGLPDAMEVGRGVPDAKLNEIYNSFDVFTLPTGGEGFGLPLLEAMSAGVPTLATFYSGHVDFMKDGAGEFIAPAEWDTCSHNGEHVLVDLEDYVLKLDRYYYEDHNVFTNKWGPRCLNGGMSPVDLAGLPTGLAFRQEAGRLARQRALEYQWSSAVVQWVTLFCDLLGRPAVPTDSSLTTNLSIEVLSCPMPNS